VFGYVCVCVRVCVCAWIGGCQCDCCILRVCLWGIDVRAGFFCGLFCGGLVVVCVCCGCMLCLLHVLVVFLLSN